MANYLDPTVHTLARTLSRAGYTTGHFGKWHMGGGRDVNDAPPPMEYGYTESFVDRFEGKGPGMHHQDMPKSHSSDLYMDKTLDFIERHKDRPFYVNFWPNDVHDPFTPKVVLQNTYRGSTRNPYLMDFYAVLDNLDFQVGRLIKALEEWGLEKNTLIIFTSDNGPTDWPRYYSEGYTPPGSSGPFRGRKWSLYEGGIRVPFIIRWKGKIPAGRVNSKSVLASIDLFPSLCEVVGIPLPRRYYPDGLDMSDALLGKRPTREVPLMWEYGRTNTYLQPGNRYFRSPNLAIREGDWKLLINYDGSRPELYNLKKDPKETQNLASKFPAKVESLSAQVITWRGGVP